jgi:uncharacterized membrane protein
MMEFFQAASLIAATITTGLMAGLFFGFACAVMPGLARADDRTFVQAMQRINVAIVNGWFLVGFIGALVLTALAGVLHLGSDDRSVLPRIGAGFVLYLAGLIVTGRLNIPLNNELVAAGEPDQITDLRAVRERFERPWVRWHLIRTVAWVAAFGCLAWALVLHGRL